MNLTETAKRNVAAIQNQALQAVVQQIEQDQGPAQILEQKFQERRTQRRFIAVEMMKILRGRPENGQSSIPGDTTSPSSETLAAVAMADTEALIAEFDKAEQADQKKLDFELQKQKNEQPRILTAMPPPGRG